MKRKETKSLKNYFLYAENNPSIKRYIKKIAKLIPLLSYTGLLFTKGKHKKKTITDC